MAQRASTTKKRGPAPAKRTPATDEGDGRRGLPRLLEERPLAAGMVSLALGLLAGLAVPGTRQEDELLGETRDRLLAEARRKGREGVDRGKRTAREVIVAAAEELAGATAPPARPSRKRAPRAKASS